MTMGTPAGDTSQPGRILLLDDDPGILHLQAKALRGEGYTVVPVGDAEAAFDCLRREAYDLIVIDYRLQQGLSGIQFYGRVRAEGPDVPAILVTAFSDESRVIEALRAGIRDVVPKSGEYLEYLPIAAGRVLAQVRAEQQLVRAEALRKSEERLRVLNADLERLVATRTGELRRAYELQAAILEGTSDLVAAVDPSLTFTAFNKAYSDEFSWLFGTTIAVGVSLLDGAVQRDAERNEWIALWQRALQGEEFTTEREVTTPQGTPRHYEVRFSSVTSATGVLVGAAHIIRDITARKQAQSALEQANEQLETRVAMRTAELQLSEQQLRDQADQLSEANRLKDEFLATLAHELRNPLAPIRFALARLQDIAPRHAHSRDVIARQVAHLVRLIDDLLDVSRITRNKIQLRHERVTLSSILQAAVESAAPLAQTARHEVAILHPLPAVWLDADPARLTQVFTNLLNNAIKFTPSGGTISCSATEHDGEVCVHVGDTGVGIAVEHLDRIFDLFYQVDSGVDRSAGGLGIGLTLVKRLVELHGGRVTAQSDGRGHGSAFTVTLPIARDPEPARPPAPASTAPRARTLRVLIVDDNVDAAELLRLVVSDFGHEAITAHDGPSALAAFEQFHADVALLDVGLPGMSGYDLAKELRRRVGAGLFLAAITGWGQEKDRRRALDAGFDCHLVKPADPAAIERLLLSVATAEPRHPGQPTTP